MQYSITQQSYQGGRDYNEDRTAIYERDDAIMLIVADGLGGHAGGEVASQGFIEAMGDSFAKATKAQLNKPDSFLTLSINFAHHSIHRRAVSQGFDVSSPKTTCVVCLIHEGTATWAHSGDSRLYLMNQRKIDYITEDHVSIRPGRGGNNPINRCVGGLESPRPEIGEQHEMAEGDILMLASDGAWHCFEADDLYDYVDPEHPSLGVDTLLQELENRNKAPSDNLSVVILFWGVKQLDKPTPNKLNEFEEEDTIQLLDNSILKSKNGDKDASEAKFDMDNLDNTIYEIENFISDLDKKL